LKTRVLTIIVWAMAAAILLVGIVRFVATRPEHSTDQRILIDKSKKNQ
jgi:capsular polysaccharide biosynthesis protein